MHSTRRNGAGNRFGRMRAETGSGWDEPELTDRERLGIRLEILVVLVVTFGLSGLNAALSLLESALSPGGVGGQTVALNPTRAAQSTIDLLFQLLSALRLAGWGRSGCICCGAAE